MRREDREGRTKVPHRNLLAPIGTKFPRSTSPSPVIQKEALIRIITVNDSDTDSVFSYVEMKIPKLPPV